MTVRALLIGLALGVFICAFTLFNDGVIRGSWFISNHFPASVFGAVVLLLFVANPLLRWLGTRWPLTLAEVAVITALGLAACGWPSFGFFWGFVPNIATPEHWQHSRLAWQANHVMSYVPGATDQLGYGHVRNWPGLGTTLLTAADDARTPAPNTPDTPGIADTPDTIEAEPIPRQVWRLLLENEQRVVRDATGPLEVDSRAAQTLLTGLNRIIREDALVPPAELDRSPWPVSARKLLEQRATRALDPHEQAHLNRWLMVSGFAPMILPPPTGQGVLLGGSPEALRARDMVLHGHEAQGRTILADIPWSAWWPALRLWGGLGVTLGVAALCLALIVHPQWSRRELLVYPLAQFVRQIAQRREDRGLPEVAFNRLFWFGLILAAAIHTLNGLAQWFPTLPLPTVPLTLNFGPLSRLVPTASRVPGIEELFWPYLYLSVIAFAFFLNTTISFSVGISFFVYVVFSVVLLSRGIPVGTGYLAAGHDTLLRFGAYLGMGFIILYIGRRYYGQLLGHAMGRGVGSIGSEPGQVPRSAIWAARALFLCFVLAMVILRSGGLDWLLAGLFVALVLLMFVVMSRIVAETGLFFVQAWWMPVAVLTAIFGAETIGPTSYIILAMASIIMVGDPRTTLMPYLSTGLQMVERSRPAHTPLRMGGPLLTMILLGFVVAGLATFAFVHARGIAVLDGWSARSLPSLPFDELATHLAELRSQLTLAQATAHDGLTSLRHLSVEPQALAWIAAGVVLIGLCSFARLRLPWWPVHPVLFLIWGTMPASRLAASFLLGWAIKWSVLKVSGSRGYRAVLPLMVGVIAGELLMALTWILSGVLYYLTTGLPPESYRVYP